MKRKKQAGIESLAKERFLLESVPIEMHILGDELTLELVHIKNPKRKKNEAEYSIDLSLGTHLTQGIGHFTYEENARKKYNECVDTLKEGYISVSISSLQLYDSSGKLIAPPVPYRGADPNKPEDL